MNSGQPDPTVQIRNEDDEKSMAKFDRIYGDKFLLARQAKAKDGSHLGMMKLGGGNCVQDLMPGPNNVKALGRRYRETRLVKARAYECNWNHNSPKYAGQMMAGVTDLPPNLAEGETFAVFMKRVTTGNRNWGWEYCGQYRVVTDPEKIKAFATPAHLLYWVCKKKRIETI
jgi:hypothetical protein